MMLIRACDNAAFELGRHASVASVVVWATFAFICVGSAHAAPFAYISNDDGTVSVVDIETNTLATTIPVGRSPVGVAVNAGGIRAYVTNSDDNTGSVINTITRTVTKTIDVGIGTEGVAVSPSGKRIYVTNYGSDSVSVIKVRKGGHANSNLAATIPVGALPLGVVVSPDGSLVYVANNGVSNSISVIST